LAKPRKSNQVSKSRRKKAPENKAPKRAGATPLFGLQSAQKVFEVAPARFRIRQQAWFARKGSNCTPIERAESFTYEDMNEFRITACMAGPRGGEAS
jgi:hypothetical protein